MLEFVRALGIRRLYTSHDVMKKWARKGCVERYSESEDCEKLPEINRKRKGMYAR